MKISNSVLQSISIILLSIAVVAISLKIILG
jgi:hypothetical protein